MYEKLTRLFNNSDLPALGTIDGDAVIVSKGKDEAGNFYRTETAQKNGWLRINQYYEDGTITETYER